MIGHEFSVMGASEMSRWIKLPAFKKGVAPFDGSPVLIVARKTCTSKVHMCVWVGPYPLRGFTVVTHWMPLPKPPK